jgi:hypothetical protein
MPGTFFMQPSRLLGRPDAQHVAPETCDYRHLTVLDFYIMAAIQPSAIS